jgi:hypothetical protein
MWDSIIACGRGFKGPSMHDLRGGVKNCLVQDCGWTGVKYPSMKIESRHGYATKITLA